MLGGSFDPVHNGHIHLAEKAMDAAGLEEVIFIPAMIPPHKTRRKLSRTAHRLNMLRSCADSIPWMRVEDVEIERGGVSYTIDTVMHFERSHPGAVIFFIIGSDSLEELHTWHKVREVAKKVTFVVVRRDSRTPDSSYPELDAVLRGTELKSIILTVEPVTISSTMIRDRIREEQRIDSLVPRAVADFIEKHGLYREA